jgi:hypothetical protein
LHEGCAKSAIGSTNYCHGHREGKHTVEHLAEAASGDEEEEGVGVRRPRQGGTSERLIPNQNKRRKEPR